MHPNGRTLRFLRWLLLAGRVEQEATETTETKFRVSYVSQVFPAPPFGAVARIFRGFREFSACPP